MNSIYLERDELKNKIFRLMNEVSKSLKNEPNVDDFLDKTNLFDYWESVLPDEEYPIFVMAVLNNIKRDSHSSITQWCQDINLRLVCIRYVNIK